MAPSAPTPTVAASSRSHVRVDPRSYSIDALFFKRLVALCRPYWFRKGALASWGLLAAILVIGFGGTAFGGYISSMTAAQSNAMLAKDVPRFWQVWATLLAAGFGLFALHQLGSLLSAWLNMGWRRWLTIHLTDDYLRHRTYYEITVDEHIDNPDQRIQEHVEPFCLTITGIPQMLVVSVMSIAVQLYILTEISNAMLVGTLLYVTGNLVLTYYIYKPTIRQNWDSTVAEADLRYGLLQVRKNAETVAFYRGESAERVHLLQRIGTAIRARMRIEIYQIKIAGLNEVSHVIGRSMPMFLIVPLFFDGSIGYGSIAQGTVAAGMLMSSFSNLNRFLPQLSNAVPTVVRLAEIQEKFQAMGEARQDVVNVPRVEVVGGPVVALDKVSIQTPGGEQQLVRELSVQVLPGQHLVIVGQTGVGKSSLLRVMAGLWTRGSGRLQMPPPGQMLFLPQRPYMLLGSLRSQLLYPRAPEPALDDAQLQAVLERVNLHDLAEHHGGFDADQDWSRVLSLGEQQRVAFARVLIAKPRYVFLDEATSAVDIETERLLYQLLRRSGTTVISVGHRPSLFAFHTNALRLMPQGRWELLSAGAVQEDEARAAESRGAEPPDDAGPAIAPTPA